MENHPIQALFFGGAFNPPTRAHIDLAAFALKALGCETVVFTPSKSRYISEEQGKDFAFSEAERLLMLRSIAANRPWMQVSDYEILADHQPRTYETLCHLREEGIPCAMLIGSDKLKELAGGWLYIPEIAREFGIVCMARGTDDVRGTIAADSYLSGLGIMVIDTPEETRSFSSTAVRRLLSAEKKDFAALRKMLPEELWDSLSVCRESEK